VEEREELNVLSDKEDRSEFNLGRDDLSAPELYLSKSGAGLEGGVGKTPNEEERVHL